jgi:linoleoyl-CoA desaturase
MHGQWDWMRDPKIHSTSWEWDNASPSSQWKHSHNEIHHTFTNVLGRDNDLGYGILRVDEDQKWSLFFLFQPIWHVANAAMFEYSIAAYDLELGAYLAKRDRMSEADKEKFRSDAREVLAKIKRQATKDYVVHPLMSAPTGSARHTLTASLVANLVRNLWTNSVIICGHFPEGIATFEKTSIEGETRGEWYLRQMLGSGNISGSKAMHLMTGNLSHQIEHHLYPDMPSNRYAEIAPRIRELMARYDLPYVTGSLGRQVFSVYSKVVQLSLPNKVEGRRRRDVVKVAAVRALKRRTAKRRS